MRKNRLKRLLEQVENDKVCSLASRTGEGKVEVLGFLLGFLPSRQTLTLLLKGRREVKKAAFTLTEVLITLGIIGIVAAMTLPTLISKFQERQNISRLLKIYSILNQANSQVVDDIGEYSGWGLSDNNQESTRKAFSYYEPYLKIIEKCDNKPGCWAYKSFSLTGQTAQYTGTNRAGVDYIGIKLLDGSYITFDFGNQPRISSYGLPNDIGSNYIIFWVDVNGDRLPNTLGKDIFMFATYQDKIIPNGYGNKSQNCKNKQGGTFAGFDCAWWVVQNKNMDYLH